MRIAGEAGEPQTDTLWPPDLAWRNSLNYADDIGDVAARIRPVQL